MTRAPLHDELMDGMQAYSLLLPDDWQLNGGITWNPLSTWAYVSVDASATAPDGSRVQFFPNGAFTYYDSTPVSGSPAPPQPGQMTGGKMFLHPGAGPADFVAKILFPAYHPAATDFEVVSVSEVEEVGQHYRELGASTMRSFQQVQRRMGPGMSSNLQLGCPLVRVRYTEGGRSFEEQFTFMYQRFDVSTEHGMGMRTYNADWMVWDVRGLRAPAGQLDRRLSRLQTIASSLTPTRRWRAIVDEINKQVIRDQTKISQMQHESSMANLKALAKQGEAMARNSKEIMERNQDSWEKSQKSSDRLSHAWSNSMHGVDDYTMPDGSTRSLDSTYEHVFTDGDSFIFTDDANLDPSIGSTTQWNRIDPITPMGGATNR